jgi:hypothetical protein
MEGKTKTIMITILVDHNIEGQAEMLLGTLTAMGWLELFPLQMKTLENVGLPFDSSDREVWRFAQANGMVLLTDNRRMKEEDSLEQTIREERRFAKQTAERSEHNNLATCIDYWQCKANTRKNVP